MSVIKRELNKAEKVLLWLPFIRFAAVTGSFAKGTANRESDIDLFLVAESGHLFTARFFTNLTFSLLGLRPNRKTSAKKFCLNYWLTTNNLLISPQTKEIAFEYTKMVPIFTEGNLYKQIIKANIAWWRSYDANLLPPKGKQADRLYKKRFLEFFLPKWLEPILKNLQLFWLNLRVKNKSRLKISDQELRLHF